MAYDNTNTGALFQNKNRTNDKQPHAKGTINIEGVEYWISAWTRVSQHGKRYQQLAVTKRKKRRLYRMPIEVHQVPTTVTTTVLMKIYRSRRR